MRRRGLLALALGGATLALPAPAARAGVVGAQERIAIVIGNSDYQAIPDLANSIRDAEAVAAMFADFGYTVLAAYDLDRRGFEDLIRTSMLNIPDDAAVVFFYAGHGIQIGARNYLLPTDIRLEAPDDLPRYSVTLDRVIAALSARGTVHVAIIDACRDNPFPGMRLATGMDSTLYETGVGFGPLIAPLNSLVAFATSPGTRARDGETGGNSPYTAALVAIARDAPREDAMTLFRRVREQVHRLTGGAQVPWESSTLMQPFHFVGPEEGPVLAAAGAGDVDAATRGAARDITVPAEVPLDRFIRIDSLITAALGTALVQPVLLTAPRFGEIAVADNGAIYYRPGLREIAAAEVPDYRHDELIQIATGPEKSRRKVSLELALAPGPCDLLAGDRLDLQGVGLYRHPNEIDAAAARAACTAAVAAHPDVARFRYQLGRAELAQNDYEAAAASFEAAVAAGHFRANYGLAMLLTAPQIDRAVHDVPADPGRARALLEQAVAEGDAYALHELGRDLFQNGTTAEERRRGFELVDRAAELGQTYSMNLLGFHYLDADNPDADSGRGMAYLTASAERDDIYGLHGLGMMAERGVDGAAPDPETALAYFEQAAAGGHPNSPVAIGRLLARDAARPPDPKVVLGWYDLGLARGDGWGGAFGARLILDGATGLDQSDAAIRAAKAALLASPRARDYAMDFLSRRSPDALDHAFQRLLNQMGAGIAEDGRVGRASLAALARLQRLAGLPAEPADGPSARLIAAARVYWARNPLRIDLF